jgi:N-acetylmuramoyl-L-alanine amidase
MPRRRDLFRIEERAAEGQLAVGHVIANRAASGRFPSSYCGVVFQRSQFSFVRGHSMPPIPRSARQWKNAVAIAKIVDQKLQDRRCRRRCSSTPAGSRRAGA